MLRKLFSALIVYPAVIILFILHFTAERKNIAGLTAAAGPGEFPTIEESLPDVTRTERVLMAGTPEETLLYIIEAEEEGPVVLVIGGIHGNEPAGSRAAETITTWAIDRGCLLVIPRANVRALSARARCAPGAGDLNRAFPGSSSGNSCQQLARSIYSVMKEFRPQWVIDLHEAREFEQLASGALGQTIIYPRTSGSLDLINQVVEAVNSGEKFSKYPFILRRGAIGGGTIKAATLLGLDGFMVETCLRQPLELRVKQHLRAVAVFMELTGVTVH